MILLDLFLEFLVVGALSFGGGYGTLAIIEDAAVSSRGWLTAAEFRNLTAFSEVTPGPVALNAASYTGYVSAGVPGAVAATAGCVFPAFCAVAALALLWKKYASHPLFRGILGSLRPAVCALVFSAFLNLFLPSVLGIPEGFGAAALLLFFACFLLSRTGKLPPAVVILLSGLCGLLLL